MDLTWLTNAVDTAANAYSKVKAADALKHQQVNADGTPYVQGQFQLTAPAAVAIPSTYLLIGAAVLLFVFLKD